MTVPMQPSLETRKPVDKLRPDDFAAFPIWEFALDEEGVEGRDETWVRPVNRARIPLGEYSQLVATDFVAALGRKLSGFMVVSTAGGKVQISGGVIVGKRLYRVLPTVSRKLAMFRGYSWSIKERETLLRSLRLKESDLFPVSFRLRVRIGREREFRSGKVA